MPSPRERMVISTALLIREQGAAATSIDAVLAHSGAPRGSVYHHFPGGREQLLREATDYAGGFISERIGAAGGSVELLDSLIADYRDQLERSDFRAGCPIVAVAVEADSGLRERAAAAFSDWQRLLAERLTADGVEARRAGELALLAIAAIEGALVLARVRRDPAPLDNVHAQLRTLIESEPTGKDSP